MEDDMKKNNKKPRAPKPASEFLAWFEQQFGKRPSKFALEQLRQKTADAKWRYDCLHLELARCEAWEDRHTIALYAWQAARHTE
jgi:hypothetical protein